MGQAVEMHSCGVQSTGRFAMVLVEGHLPMELKPTKGNRQRTEQLPPVGTVAQSEKL